MTKKTIAVLIRTAVVLLAITGVICCVLMHRIVDYMLPGFSPTTHRMWLYALYLCAVPCFCSLVPAWLVAGNIGNNRSFCTQNAAHMRLIGFFTLADAVIVCTCNILYYLIGRSFFAFFVAFFLLVAAFGAVSVCAFALSSLLKNATELQDQSDWTI